VRAARRACALAPWAAAGSGQAVQRDVWQRQQEAGEAMMDAITIGITIGIAIGVVWWLWVTLIRW